MDDALMRYEEAVRRVSDTKQRVKNPTVAELDRWVDRELPQILAKRKHMTAAELQQLMRWKLARGQWRPRLQKLVEENSDDAVVAATKAACAAAVAKGDSAQDASAALSAALAQVTVLRGVGPALASAVLCAVVPQLAPYMSDEALEAATGLGKAEYTVKHYLKFAAWCRDKAAELSVAAGHGSTRPWTARDVGKALWAQRILGIAIGEPPKVAGRKGSKSAEQSSASEAAAQASSAATGANLSRAGSAVSSAGNDQHDDQDDSATDVDSPPAEPPSKRARLSED